MLKVTGESLSPFFLQGDYVLVSKLPYWRNPLRSGDIIVFQHPDYGVMIKQVERVSEDGEEIYVIGTHPLSTDSRQFGAIPRRTLLGKVVWQIRR